MRTVTTVTGPAVEPVTVAEVRAYARIDSDDEDDLIQGWVETARAAAEHYTRRSFITRTLRLSLDGGYGLSPWVPGHYDLPVDYFDGSLGSTLELPLGPVIAVTSVTTYDTLNAATLYAGTRYTTYGDRLMLNSGETWPGGLRAIGGTEIVYTAGYGPSAVDVPRPIRTAITMHAALLYERECGAEVPPGAQMLLQPYRVMA